MDTPVPFLSLAYWLHMLATLVWIGGLSAMAILILPAARRALDASAYARLLADLQRRLDPLGWMSLIVLVGTGLFQMSANPNYDGFLRVDNLWAGAILLKHLVFFGMTGISAYLTWGVLPGLRRAALQLEKGREAPEAARLLKQEIIFLRLNLVLGVIVLALTAIARAA
jgi:uncharacterized membrane protein